MATRGHPMAGQKSGTLRHRVPICFFAAFGVMEDGSPMPPCDGELVKCHLIARQLLRREGAPPWDGRVWVWACGGPMGNGGHHGMLDHTRTLKLPRSAIPEHTEAFAMEYGLTWWLTREYGEREDAPVGTD